MIIKMECQTQVSPPSQPLHSPRHQLQSPSSSNEEDTQKKNRPESHQLRSRIAPPSFPQEIIVEVLSNLPVKPLLRFRCVSKSWKALVSDPFFVKKHVRNPMCRPKIRVLINTSSTQTSYPYGIQSCSISSLFQDPIVNTKEIEYPALSSCDGLICVVSRLDTIFLINPILGVFKRLPDSGLSWRSGCFTVHGFGFDAAMDDYKVVRVFSHRSKGFDGSYESIVRIYSLRTNYWRRIQDFPSIGLPPAGNGKLVDGCLNWLVFCRQGVISSYTIVSLDLARETYKEVMLPCYGERVQSCKTLWILDGCLCVLCARERSYTDVWVMKEYGKKESWSKLATIPYMHSPGFGLLFSAPLFVSESGEILLRSGSNLIMYNPKEKSCRKPVIPHAVIPKIQQVEVYEESLVSPQL